MTIENVALINGDDQVINHVVVDTDDTETMAALHEAWGTVRYVVTSQEDIIILDPSPVIWTTHSEETGFVLPTEVISEVTPTFTKIKIGERIYPSDSLLIKENARNRPAGWILPEDEEEVFLVDGEEI